MWFLCFSSGTNCAANVSVSPSWPKGESEREQQEDEREACLGREEGGPQSDTNKDKQPQTEMLCSSSSMERDSRQHWVQLWSLVWTHTAFSAQLLQEWNPTGLRRRICFLNQEWNMNFNQITLQQLTTASLRQVWQLRTGPANPQAHAVLKTKTLF